MRAPVKPAAVEADACVDACVTKPSRGSRGWLGRAVEPPACRGELDRLRGAGGRRAGGVPYRRHLRRRRVPGEGRLGEHPSNSVCGLGAAWGMPLQFVISGMGICYSLRSRSAGAFARERLRRLGSRCWSGCSPWWRCRSTSACATPVTPAPPPASPPLLERAPLARVPARGHGGSRHRPLPDRPLVVPGLPAAFSLAWLPGFALRRRSAGARLVGRLAGLLTRPGAVFLLALPLAAVELRLWAARSARPPGTATATRCSSSTATSSTATSRPSAPGSGRRSSGSGGPLWASVCCCFWSPTPPPASTTSVPGYHTNLIDKDRKTQGLGIVRACLVGDGRVDGPG